MTNAIQKIVLSLTTLFGILLSVLPAQAGYYDIGDDGRCHIFSNSGVQGNRVPKHFCFGPEKSTGHGSCPAGTLKNPYPGPACCPAGTLANPHGGSCCPAGTFGVKGGCCPAGDGTCVNGF